MGTLRRPRARAGGRRLTHVAGASFERELERASPAELLIHGARSRPTVVVCEPTAGALVLGSGQDATTVDVGRCAAAGLAVLRRRSGGGAVIVRPAAQVWLDVFLPRGDRRLEDDVLGSFSFLGLAWREALVEDLGLPPSALTVVEPGEAMTTPTSRAMCFAGRGAGEVLLGGRKLVGISQRRDRSGAWFHSMAMLAFDPAELPSLLGLSAGALEAAAGDLATATVLPAGAAGTAGVAAAVVRHLP